MTSSRGWGFAEQHLALDALVAFVDGELTLSACDRAAAHLASCSACAAEAAAQRQARAAVRSASTPSMSPGFLRSLQSIPINAELPGQPDELALTEEGQLVTATRGDSSGGEATRLGNGRALGESTPLGASQRPLGTDRSKTPAGASGERGTSTTDRPSQGRTQNRRTRQGAGVMFSGLALGALAFMNIPDDEPNSVTEPRPFFDGTVGDPVGPGTIRPAAVRHSTSTVPAEAPSHVGSPPSPTSRGPAVSSGTSPGTPTPFPPHR